MAAVASVIELPVIDGSMIAGSQSDIEGSTIDRLGSTGTGPGTACVHGEKRSHHSSANAPKPGKSEEFTTHDLILSPKTSVIAGIGFT
ncbi:hypothetical protein NXC14_PC00697 (plasmid) [Rhizobium sp. NXC14]|nr:hypothetical protein NXC14_PC00697 [Rhizobium sp. NXC14]